MILSIETATSNCSVALHSLDGELLHVEERDEPNIHASKLFVFIKSVLEKNPVASLKAIAVSKGPGSYTGLRIGVSAAKGLCYGLDLPLIAINTLQGMAYNAAPLIEKDALLIPMIDARRMEVYNAIYDSKLNEVNATCATIIDETSFTNYLSKPCYFFGDGMPKCKEVLGIHPNAFFLDDVKASAKAIGAQAVSKYKNGQFEDLAYFEPYYLKEFVTQSTFHTK